MGTDSTLSAMLVVTGIAYAARWPMAAGEPEQLAENLYNRLRAVTEQLDQIRDEAADLAADLRNRLNALMLQRRAVERLDGNRQARIEQQSEAGNRSDQRRGPAA
jgi:cytochrome c-type biogenesis protein CcmH/NrfF